MHEEKPSISACFLWLFVGLLCCSSLAIMFLNLANGITDQDVSIRDIILWIFGLSMLFRGIAGFHANRVDNSMSVSFVWFIWLIIGVPTAFSLLGVILALLDFSENWYSLINIIPIAIGVMAITSAYENKPDAFYLIKIQLVIQAVGLIILLLNIVFDPTSINIFALVFKTLFVSFGFLYLFLSKDAVAILPPEIRTKSLIGKWLFIVFIVIYSALTLLIMIGLFMD